MYLRTRIFLFQDFDRAQSRAEKNSCLPAGRSSPSALNDPKPECPRDVLRYILSLVIVSKWYNLVGIQKVNYINKLQNE